MPDRPPFSSEAVANALRPLEPVLTPLIQEARQATSIDTFKGAVPKLVREAHFKRLRGISRWMLVADGLVDADLPPGFSVVSTEKDHNQGKYAIGFPMGVITVKREPHQDDNSGVYLQEQLDGMRELSDSADQGHPDLTVYLSVPPEGGSSFLVTRPDLTSPLDIGLEYLARTAAPAPQQHPAATGPKPRAVRSSRKKTENLPEAGPSATSS